MSIIPRQQTLEQQVVALAARVDSLAAAVAAIPRGNTGGPPAPVYDANVVRNPGIEQGLVGWGKGYWTGPDTGQVTLETVNPISGAVSLAVTKQNLNEEQQVWSTEPTLMTGGDTVRLEGTVRGGHPEGARIMATVLFGRDDPSDCFRVFDERTVWVAVYDGVPIDSGGIVRVDGEATVPTTHRWAAASFRLQPPVGQPSVAQPWTWWLDDVSLRAKL